MNWKAIIAIAIKDLKLFKANPRAVIITLLVPVAIASFFGSLFAPRKKGQGTGVQVLVVNQDTSATTSEIVSNLVADSNLKVRIVPEAEARKSVTEGKAPVAVVFPRGFGEGASLALFGAAAKPELTILQDPSRSIEAAMVNGLLVQHVMQTVTRKVFSPDQGRRFVQMGLDSLGQPSDLDDATGTALRDMLKGVDRWMETSQKAPGGQRAPAGGGLSVPFRTHHEQMSSKAGLVYNGYAHSFGGMGVQFILMYAVEAAVAMLYERRSGMWRRLRAAPVSRGALLAGRALSCSLISMFTLTVCWGFAILIFKVQVAGSWIGFIACNAAVSLFSASVAILLAAVGRTPEATRGLSIFVVLMLVMLGGAWIPSFIFPEWLQTATLITPTRWAVDGLDAMTWRGLGLGNAVGSVAVLLGYSAVFGLIAWQRMRADED